MTEREKKPEGIPELEFWDGHHSRDNCPKSREKFHLLISNPRGTEGVLGRLASFIDKSVYAKPIRKLSKGDLFSPSQYPVGTILSISFDSLYRDKRNYRVQIFGVVRQLKEYDWDSKYHDVVIGFPIKSLIKKPIDMSDVCILYVDPDFPAMVGEVIHYKDRGFFSQFGFEKRSQSMNLLDHNFAEYFPREYLNSRQALFRYNTVVVWAYGLGIRRHEREPKRFERKVWEPS